MQIVENASRATAPIVFRLGTKPILELGGLQQNPDDEFTNFSQLRGVLLRAGGIAIGQVVASAPWAAAAADPTSSAKFRRCALHAATRSSLLMARSAGTPS